jgi:hypothetical protein
MANNSRLMLQVAATTGIAIMLSAAPAMAAGGSVAARGTVATAHFLPSVIRHHASHRSYVAMCPNSRRASSIRSDLGCSGAWCGRQFVLMVGIGY